jgi:hypothetical protein
LDQMVSATFHTTNPKGLPNSLKRPLFRHFVWEIVKSPATSIALPLWLVRSWLKVLIKPVKHKNIPARSY